MKNIYLLAGIALLSTFYVLAEPAAQSAKVDSHQEDAAIKKARKEEAKRIKDVHHKAWEAFRKEYKDKRNNLEKERREAMKKIKIDQKKEWENFRNRKFISAKNEAPVLSSSSVTSLPAAVLESPAVTTATPATTVASENKQLEIKPVEQPSSAQIIKTSFVSPTTFITVQ